MTDEVTKKKIEGKLLLLLGVSTAFLLATPIIVLLFVGMFLDSLFSSSPFFIIFLTILGAIGGTMNVIRLITNYKVMH